MRLSTPNRDGGSALHTAKLIAAIRTLSPAEREQFRREFDRTFPDVVYPRLATKTVGVMGSGRDPHWELSNLLGRLLGKLEVNLLTGGGAGVMEAVAKSFVESKPRRGISIGVLPARREDPAERLPGDPNVFVQLPIVTHLSQRGRAGHLPGSRNHINILSSDAIVALPGSHGTESELGLAMQYGKTAVIFYRDPAAIERFPASVARYDDIDELEHFLRIALDLPPANDAGKIAG